MLKKSKIFSKGIRQISNLANFLFDCELLPNYFFTKKTEQIIGWGLRPSTKKARAYAQKHGLPYIALEDGFLRSLGLGVQGSPLLSLVYDDIGIYYDTTRPSRLENLILHGDISCEQMAQAQRAMALIVQYRLSKYNQAVDFVSNFAKNPIVPVVLVVDQTVGDMAVQYGQANAGSFQQMLRAAVAENPQAEIWVKTHPDVLCGKKSGYFPMDLSSFNVRILAEDVNPISLLEVVNKVYCVTSQMGFEALLVGKPVVTFGVPWYAGWGLTDDRHPYVATLMKQWRRKTCCLAQLFYAAYFEYCRYVDPQAGKISDIFTIIDYLHQMKQRNKFLTGKIYCVGVSWWKRAFLKTFFDFPNCELLFISFNKFKKLPRNKWENSRLLVWGQGKLDYLLFAEQHKIPVLRMEDGFIRSVGLGSNLVTPLSLVVDDLGIYFNPKQPSRLEWILQNQLFTEKDLIDAEQVKIELIQTNIGKYNVGKRGVILNSQGKKSILVVGQVEDDASIKLGTVDIYSNLALLKKVREENPNDFILYKAHPDVVSGNRVGYVSPKQILVFADEIIENADILDCINQVDEVHTMTSLAGFEALLRGKTVHCYGIPFYSGWGLTQDHCKIPRRTRRLKLNELIAGVLMYYPFYINPTSRQFISVQYTIKFLAEQKQKINGEIHRSWINKQFHKLKQIIKTLIN